MIGISTISVHDTTVAVAGMGTESAIYTMYRRTERATYIVMVASYRWWAGGCVGGIVLCTHTQPPMCGWLRGCDAWQRSRCYGGCILWCANGDDNNNYYYFTN